ncbi:hypothetical protein NGA35_10590 [Pseudomonas stutzeri]|nr:hypothetical protein [Stutzerimonas stutzeri]
MSDYDPYRPPRAPLLDPHLPPAFVGGDWSRGQLRVLGALSLGCLSGLLVLLLVALWRLFNPLPPPLSFVHLLSLLLVLLWSYLLLRLRDLLAARYALAGLERPLLLQLLFALLATGIGALLDEDWLERADEVLAIAYFALFVALGLSLAWFALRLRRIRRPWPALRLFAWLLLLAGAAAASVVLLLPALLLGLGAAAALAWVFFAAAGELGEGGARPA